MNNDHEEGLSAEQFAVVFQTAYNDHGRKLRYYAMKFLNNPQDAEDIVGALFARLWAKGPVFNRDKLNWNYLKKAVRNACLDHLDAKGRFERLSLSADSAEQGAVIPSHEEDLI